MGNKLCKALRKPQNKLKLKKKTLGSLSREAEKPLP
jgi:hypothetical protein